MAIPQLSESGMSLDELFKLLQQGLDPDTMASEKGTLLHYAAAEGAVDAIRLLVHHGATLDFPDMLSGNTPLHLAAGLRQLAACRELVALGANVDARNNSGTTPLMVAAGMDESGDCVRALVQAGADIDALDERGMMHFTLLLHTAIWGQPRRCWRLVWLCLATHGLMWQECRPFKLLQ